MNDHGDLVGSGRNRSEVLCVYRCNTIAVFDHCHCLCTAKVPAMDSKEVAEMVKRGLTHKEISEVYQRHLSTCRGLSERSDHHFCHLHGVHNPRGDGLDNIVDEPVKEV